MNIPNKPIEIFCGTGGVGKTSLATSRALYLAKSGKKILLITIDPSKRLKQVLGLNEEMMGEVECIDFDNTKLWAILMNPQKTIQRMAKSSGHDNAHNNRIIKILTRPYGGMNEILAIIEVEHHLSSKEFDVIILDTPPGKHFVDFLESVNKIQAFFDHSFVEIFKFLGKKINSKDSTSIGLLSMVVSSGVKKLLSYLEKVTGKDFIDEFIEAIITIYNLKNSFLKGLNLQQFIKLRENSNWFLVTSVDQHKFNEAKEIKDQAVSFFHEDSFIILNKCTEKYWKEEKGLSPIVEHVKDSILKRERHLKEDAKNQFKNVLEFPELLSVSIHDQTVGLTSTWKEFNV